MEFSITSSTKTLSLTPLNRTVVLLTVSLKNSTLEFKNRNYLNSQTLSSFSRQFHFHLQQSQFHRSPFCVSESTSSSLALGPEKDRLEADIEDTETEEPNSRVGFHFDTEYGDKVLPGFLDSTIGFNEAECKELFHKDLPKLDDSLADKLIPGCTTLEQVRETLLQKCREEEQTTKEQATDNAILDQLHKMAEIDIAQTLFQEKRRLLYGAQLLQTQNENSCGFSCRGNLYKCKTYCKELKFLNG